MKLILVCFLLISSVYAKDRPKIALVLSGGGARGGAHVGVLKVLEKNKIPIDILVGTSMGSFVGGLYVSGKSPQEIESMLTSTQWNNYIRTDYNRQDTPMRKKEIDYTYQGLLGLGINADNTLVLPTGVLKREPMLLKFMELTQDIQDINDFNKLSIPFRAVATNIRNGDAVVLKSGNLAEAIYASSAIPGGFQPISINGIDLVDGGVSDNFPIQVAKDMGADIIIAVDVSENFEKNLDVDSYFVVMGQLVNILMRKNANKSILKLTDKDILLTPDLEGFGGLDVDKYKEIIEKGVEVAEKNDVKLRTLSISDKAYRVYQEKHRKKHHFKAPIIDKIEIDNPTYLSDESIRLRLHQKLGKELDLVLLRKDLLHLYHMMIFDSILYEIKVVESETILVIHLKPSWDNHGEIRFALGIEDDFKGHSAYSLKLGYTMFGLNAYGGEWKNDFEIGRYEKAYTEFFQPLDPMSRYYIKPSIRYERTIDIFTSDLLTNQEIQSHRYGGSFFAGMHIGTNLEIEAGVSIYKDNIQVDIVSLNNNYNARPLQASIKIDNLDNVNFPKVGMRSTLKWIKEISEMGSDYEYEQIYFDIEKPINFYSNNLTLFAKYANTYLKKDDIDRLAGIFTLGGLFNLSGYAPYSFAGDNMALGVLKYTYEMKNGGFFGTLNAPLYAGFSLEAGDAWDNDTHVDFKYSGTLYVAADTFMGPFYLAFASSTKGDRSAYLYLGEKF